MALFAGEKRQHLQAICDKACQAQPNEKIVSKKEEFLSLLTNVQLIGF